MRHRRGWYTAASLPGPAGRGPIVTRSVPGGEQADGADGRPWGTPGERRGVGVPPAVRAAARHRLAAQRRPTPCTGRWRRSLVFVDISGFTALTERLARKGKVGAELMRDTLDGVFRALLDEAYDWGAGLLKWGGDALLLMFDGPGHALARVPGRLGDAANDRPRRAAPPLGRDASSLRMSVGIGTGTYHFFMTGSVHRELLIAGPAMTETLTMEAIADAGEIGISPALAALLDAAAASGPQKDGDHAARARRPTSSAQRAPDVGDVSALDIASCIPVAARAHVLLRKSEPEHRTITAAFIDLMDTDRLLEELGPEVLGQGLDERMRSIQEAALRYEVPFYETDVGKSSVKALLTAGAPSSTGHDEERMLRTLRDDHGSSTASCPMRIGVNTGKVFTGDFGPPYRRAYRVFGDAINTAARVMSKARGRPDPVDGDRAQPVAHDLRGDADRAVRGEGQVGAGQGVHRRAGHRGQGVAPRRACRWSGATQELRRRCWMPSSGHGPAAASIVEIGGEAGMGKSRLVQEVVARSQRLPLRSLALRGVRGIHAVLRVPVHPARRPSISTRTTDSDAVVARLRRGRRSRVDPSLVPWIPLLGDPARPGPAGHARDAPPSTSGSSAIAWRRWRAASWERRSPARPSIFVIEDMPLPRRGLARPAVAPRRGRPRSDGSVLIVTHQGAGTVIRRGRPGRACPTIMVLELRPLSIEHA